MADQYSFSHAELALLIELLERERRDLPAEIHHTDTARVRDELHRRLETVDLLLKRLRGAAVETELRCGG
ncbi:MAG TPA: hypothetical protein VFA54_17680 [Bryobacterales bacterium]|jgi:hypothetical protein|nr:hypothetical protein [Bryobacterales bacterium]